MWTQCNSRKVPLVLLSKSIVSAKVQLAVRAASVVVVGRAERVTLHRQQLTCQAVLVVADGTLAHVCAQLRKKCNKCGRLGHFATVCRTKTFVRDSREPPWTTVLQFGGCDVKFKIDTGADVSVISSTQYKSFTMSQAIEDQCSVKECRGVLKFSRDFSEDHGDYPKGCTQHNLLFDDILVYSENEQAHEKHLERVMKTLASANLKLNYEKCELRKHEIEFLVIESARMEFSPDPESTSAIDATAGEGSRVELGSMQVKAMADVKKLLTSAPTLAFYDPAKLTIVSSDASSYGIGVCCYSSILKVLKAVAYCSRTLTASECRYAQIEKETLAAVWACEKFSRYLIGLDNVRLETDHKPIVPLINNRDLQDTPIRCQRMLMRLMRFSITAEYVPGKKLVIADVLSRSPQLTTAESEVITLSEDVEAYLSSVDIFVVIGCSFRQASERDCRRDKKRQTDSRSNSLH
ncbi:hypothetical protein C0Q70_14454 [Pomacea canaliculata]|uniref:CCHC-type domain-containing protein n=1 Tax=Pomacea canaliculata TaxID=400727 RepID=A0A2T7P049_POMCA|nr:hypothetical protein C0Q70_14454 [Pomacea canaliculata]